MKLERAQQNYLEKVNKVSSEISRGEDELFSLYRVEESRMKSSSRVSSEYYDSFFPTSTIL